MPSFYVLMAIVGETGPLEYIKTIDGLDEARAEADRLIEMTGYYAIGVRPSRSPRHNWSYLISNKAGPTLPGQGKKQRVTKKPSPPLPMRDNPVLGGAENGK